MTLRPAAAASCLLAPLALLTARSGGGGDGDPVNPWRERPAFLAAEPVRTDYDGTTQGLLTGKAASLAEPVTWRAPASPTAADLCTLAIQTSYTGLLDMTPAGGFGTYYGRLAPAANKGTEYVAVSDDGSGTRNGAIVVGIPSGFDPLKPCVVAIPSSGSRGVYGEVGTIGEWAYNKGCATALTDKGTDVGLHDLDRDLAPALDDTLAAAGQRKDLTFNANLLGDDLAPRPGGRGRGGAVRARGAAPPRALDRLRRRGAGPGPGLPQPLVVDCQALYGARRHEALECFARAHGLRHLMLFGDVAAQDGAGRWLVLYRSDDMPLPGSRRRWRRRWPGACRTAADRS